MNTPRDLGVGRIAWRGDLQTAETEAAALGFAHLDVYADEDTDFPIGMRFATRPTPGCAWPAPPATADRAREIERLRTVAQPIVEPWAGSLFGSDDAIHQVVAEVPDLRIVLDVGHVTCWGGDVRSLLPYAAHVQIRQAALGHAQLPALEGDVDLARLVDDLDRAGYAGPLSVEYFDLPRFGWPMPDPVGEAAALADRLRPMLGQPSSVENTARLLNSEIGPPEQRQIRAPGTGLADSPRS